MTKHNQNNKEAGSAIIWILMAVALFAALNFAFNSSTRTSTSTLDDAAATAYANQIIAYGNEVKNAVKRLTLRGCIATEISFDNDAWTRIDETIKNHSAGDNPNAPTDKSCHVFSENGGQIEAKFLSNVGISTNGLPPIAYKPGSSKAFYAVIDDIGTSEAELALHINLITNQICKKINNILEIPHASIPIETCIGYAECSTYRGFIPSSPPIGYGDSESVLIGKSKFCHHWSPSGWGPNINYYTHVLIAR